MKKTALKTFEELIKDAPKLEMQVGDRFPGAFKEKMEKAERILAIAGVPKRPKK
jgi:hypothetical protein